MIGEPLPEGTVHAVCTFPVAPVAVSAGAPGAVGHDEAAAAPMNDVERSLFGEPVLGFTTTFDVAFAVSAVATAAGEAHGFVAR